MKKLFCKKHFRILIGKNKCVECERECSKPIKEEWEDWFPLNTFYGETKRQLVECVRSILKQQKNKLIKDERIEKDRQ